MFEDDWVDDYEDFDAADTDQPNQTHSRRRVSSREPKTARREPLVPSTVQRRKSGDPSAPSGRAHSASSGGARRAPDGRDLSASSGGGRGVTWRSPYLNVPMSGTTEAYRRPQRHLTVGTTPSGEQGGKHPAKEEKQREARRTRTFVATVRTPASGDKEETSTVSKPFVVRVSYGGKSGRTTKELKFGARSCEEFPESGSDATLELHQR